MWPLRGQATRGTLEPALLLLVEGVRLQTIPLYLQYLVDHLTKGATGMTREGHLETRVQPLLEAVHLFLLGIGLTWSIPHHAGETSGVLLNLLGALGDVAKLLHLGIHDTFGHVVFTEGLGELLPRDTPRVLVGVTVAVPPCACSASELVGGDPHALLGGDGVIIGSVESRRPQLEETLQLPLKVMGRTPVAVKHPLS